MADDSKATPRWRFDQTHRQPPNPHLFDFPKKPEIRLLLVQLDDEDVELRGFARRLSTFPGLNRYVVAMANYRLAAVDRRIDDSGHASVLLGIRGLHDVLESLLEEDPPQSVAG
ncbi:MAG: hypothetical protein ABGZ35_08700 [Planctomycetaceae bacterium]|jgi:HD-like signal output (HDOD) protein